MNRILTNAGLGVAGSGISVAGVVAHLDPWAAIVATLFGLAVSLFSALAAFETWRERRATRRMKEAEADRLYVTRTSAADAADPSKPLIVCDPPPAPPKP